MLLSEAIEALCIATRADGRSPRTVSSYREKLSYLADFIGGDNPVEDIKVAQLRAYVADQWDRDLSPFTVAGRVRALKRLFNWLTDEGILAENPAARVKTPRPKRIEPKGITEADFRRLLASTLGETIADIRDRAILFFLRDTGCRVAGLTGLQVRDLDVEEGTARVCEKGNKIRVVFFTERTRDALRAWLAVRPTDQGASLFVSLHPKSQGGLTPRGISHMLRRRGEQAGVEGPHSPHSFRHAFARDYLMNGGDLATLADLMGHTDIGITRRWYVQFTTKQLQSKHARHSPVARMAEDGRNDEK
jgi:site-specific recombinase XerD